MNKWVFDTILPLVNKDVVTLSEYIGLSKTIQCRCRICGEEFSTTPTKLLQRHLHSHKQPCKWSENNILLNNQIESLKTRLSELWSTYGNQFEMTYDHLPHKDVTMTCKKCGGTRNYSLTYLLSYKVKCKQCSMHKRKEKISKLCDTKYKSHIPASHRKYRLHDKLLNKEIVGTVSEILEYAGRSRKPTTFKVLRKLKWFKARFTLVKSLDDDCTYIKRECKDKYYCFSTNKFLCENCAIMESKYYTVQEFGDAVREINPNFVLLSHFKEKDTVVKCKCNQCNGEFEMLPVQLVNRRLCPICMK